MWSWTSDTFRENKLIFSALSWLLLSLLLSCKTCYMRASLSNASLTWLWPPWWIMDTSTQLNTQRAYRTVQAPVLSVISRSISKYLLFVNPDQFYSRERSQKLRASPSELSRCHENMCHFFFISGGCVAACRVLLISRCSRTNIFHVWTNTRICFTGLLLNLSWFILFVLVVKLPINMFH